MRAFELSRGGPDRDLHRRAQGARRADAPASRAARRRHADRPAHASGLHQVAGRTPRSGVGARASARPRAASCSIRASRCWRPGGKHLRVATGGRVSLTDEPEIGALRPRADLTIGDAAKVFGERTLLVVMTGMGNDGLAGAEEVRRRGGRILVEAESTCTVYGMPRAVEEAKLADEVLPLDELAAGDRGGGGRMTLTSVDDYVEFCTFLRRLTGIDLSQYKRPQMERRLRTFYANKGVLSLTDAIERLRTDPAAPRGAARPDHDQRLAAVAQPGAVGHHPEPSAARARRPGSVARVERRLLLRRRGLHTGDALPPGPSRQARHDHRHRHRQAHGRAGSPRALQRGRRAHGSREAAGNRLRPRRRRLAGEAEPALDDALRSATCCRCSRDRPRTT